MNFNVLNLVHFFKPSKHNYVICNPFAHLRSHNHQLVFAIT